MSFVVQVWELPADAAVPTSLRDALRLVDALRAHAVPNPKFIEFARRLTARYPCITSPESDELDESELAWSDGPLDGECDSAVYAIGLASGRLDEVHPFVIATARALGLNTMDEQSGACFLADGSELSLASPARATRDVAPPPVARAAPVAKPGLHPGLPDLSGLLDRMVQALQPFLDERGFVPDRQEPPRSTARMLERPLRASFPGGDHQLVLIAVRHDRHLELGLVVVTRIDVVSDAMVKAAEWKRYPPGLRPATSVLRQRGWLGAAQGLTPGQHGDFHHRFDTPEDLPKHGADLLGLCRTRLAPLLDQLQTVKGLDALLNPAPLSASLLGVDCAGAQHLIAARLAGRRDIERLCDDLLANLEQNRRFFPLDDSNAIERFIAHERAHAAQHVP